MVRAGQRRADAGGQPDVGPNAHNPMGSGCGGCSTLTICVQRRQQPPQLSHNYRLTAHAGNCLDRIANELENKLLQLFRLLGARRFAAKTIQPRTSRAFGLTAAEMIQTRKRTTPPLRLVPGSRRAAKPRDCQPQSLWTAILRPTASSRRLLPCVLPEL